MLETWKVTDKVGKFNRYDKDNMSNKFLSWFYGYIDVGDKMCK